MLTQTNARVESFASVSAKLLKNELAKALTGCSTGFLFIVVLWRHLVDKVKNCAGTICRDGRKPKWLLLPWIEDSPPPRTFFKGSF